MCPIWFPATPPSVSCARTPPTRAFIEWLRQMKRIVEPELMSAEEQARAYAQADFEEAHSSYPKLFSERFPRRRKRAFVLDLGCGPCDVTLRFAKANPTYTFHAVDGSAAMLKFGRVRLVR